jgi:hypothetical protein
MHRGRFRERLNRRTGVAVCLLLATVLGLAYLSGCGGQRAAGVPSGGITARQLVQPDAIVGDGPSSLNWSPAGARLSYVGPDSGKDVLWLYDP